MKRLLLSLILLLSLSAAAQSQYQSMTVAQLEEQKKLAIENRDFLVADQISKELLTRRSLDELEADFNELKSKAAAKGDFTQAAFYKQLAQDVQALRAMDDQIKVAVQEEDYLKANELQQKYKAEKARLTTAKYGEDVDYVSQQRQAEAEHATRMSSLLEALEADTPTASQETESTPSYTAPREEYYVSQNSTSAVLDNVDFSEGSLQFAMENTHAWTVGSPQMFGGASNSIFHGAFVGGLSYGFNYFDYDLSFENYSFYGTTYWAKAGVGYSYNTNVGGAFVLLQSGIVNFSESTTSYLDANGILQFDDAANTTWFPENSASIKIGTVLHPNFLNRKSDSQWGLCILSEVPFATGAEPVYSIGLSVSSYKRK